MLYKFAVSTALRASEIASMTWESLDLDNPEPTVTVLAAYSKHRREDVLLLPRKLVQDLKAWRLNRNDDDKAKVFETFNPKTGARMLRADLEMAGIPYADTAGRVADFHSLRHSCATYLVSRGVDPKVVQMYLRHSSIGLTMDRYTHLHINSQQAALEALPTLPTIYGDHEGQNRSSLAKTGTDDLPSEPKEMACTNLAHPTSISVPEQSLTGTEQLGEDLEREGFDQNGNGLSEDSLDTDGQELALTGTSKRRGGDSNPRYSLLTVRRFSKPLL